MSSMADLKGAITRVQSALDYAEKLRPDLSAAAIEGLDVIKENAELMRAEIDKLVADMPPLISMDEARGPEEQIKIDQATRMLNAVGKLMEEWLETWGT